jgi:autotransporter-associated beta strand protein
VSAPSGFGLSADNTRAIVLTNLNLSGAFALSNGVANGGGYTAGGPPTNGFGAVVYAGNAANFTGPLVTSLGTTLQAWSQTNLGGNPGVFQPVQFVLDNGIFQPLANMGLTNANSGVTINPGGGTFNVGFGLTLTIANPIAGTGAMTNMGGGVLALSGVSMFTGAVIINAGALALRGAGSLAASPNITVAGGAMFDVSGLNSTFTLGAGQTLSNSAVNAIIAGANNTGPGTIWLTYDGLNPAFVVTNGGMTLSSNTVLKVRDTGAQLAVGGTYKVIAKAAAGNAGLVAGVPPGSVTVVGSGTAGIPSLLISNAELYLNVAPILPGVGTNIIFSLSGQQLNLSWPSNYTGWLLQSNSMGLAATNDWFTVPGSDGTDSVPIFIAPGEANVFYRMAHPN